MKKYEIQPEFGTRLRQRRDALDLTQRQVVDRMNIEFAMGKCYDTQDIDFLESWETPCFQERMDTLAVHLVEHLAYGYSTTVEYIVGETDEGEPIKPNRRDAVMATREKYK